MNTKVINKFIIILIIGSILIVISQNLIERGLSPKSMKIITKSLTFTKQSFNARKFNSSERNYIHSRNEIELTKVVVINQKKCLEIHSISVFVFTSATTSGKHFNKRQFIRKTWAQDVKSHKISLYFVIGLSTNETINRELRQESDKYSDIMQFGFIDHYFNLTLKTLSVLRWVNKYCAKSPNILKSDDDVIINIKTLLNGINGLKTGIYGYITTHNEWVIRDVNRTRKYMPYKYYSGRNYPPYIYGCSYVLATYSAQLLFKAFNSYSGYILDVEDVFVNGILAQNSSIDRFGSNLFQFNGCNITDVCLLYKYPVMFNCQPDKIESFWNQLQNKSCL